MSVDSGGQTDFTSMRYAFFGCVNLVSVPASSEGIDAITDMEGMFCGAISFNQDLSGWCVTNIFSEPTDFDTGATRWENELEWRPQWGNCPE